MEYTAVEKALLILKKMARLNRAIGPSELAAEMVINKATVNRMMLTMKKHGFLDQDPLTRQYRLGPEAAVMGQAVAQALEGKIVAIAQPYIDRLRDEVGETVHLEVLSGQNMYLAYVAVGPGLVTVAPSVGDHVLPSVHAGAKAIAAFYGPERRDKLIGDELPAFTENTITDRGILYEQFEEIRKSGVAISRGEFNKNVLAIGAPIFNSKGEAIAALVIITILLNDSTEPSEQAITTLKETAAAISKLLYSQRIDSK